MNKENFVVTIGDFGSSITLHSGNSVKENLFLEKLTEENKTTIRSLLNKNSSASVYIILDTLDQTYKKKTYPLISENDLKKIAKKEIEVEGDKNGLHNYITYVPKKATTIKKSECLYISASKPDLLNDWIDLLFDLKNHLVGIYMLPVECFHLSEKIKNINSINKQKESKGNQIQCLVIQTKIGGIRQIIFSDHGIVFTRIVNYSFQEPDWQLRYEQDIYSTFEYLKRSFTDINIGDLKIVNILPQENLETIKSINNKDLNITNYTPQNLAEHLGYKSLITDQEIYCDLLIAKTFSQQNKILRFTLPKIEAVEKVFLILKISKFFNLGMIGATLITTLLIFFAAYKINYLSSDSQKEKLTAVTEYNKALSLSSSAQNISDLEEGLDIDKVLDLGKVDEHLRLQVKDFLTIYNELKFLKNSNVQLEKFGYSLLDFSLNSPSQYPQYQFDYAGTLNNKSGDIDDLFKEFDLMSSNTKKYFSDYQIDYKEIPTTIDFTKKYYTFPIEFTFKKQNSITPENDIIKNLEKIN